MRWFATNLKPFLANRLIGVGRGMLNDPTGDGELGSPMKVRELIERLKNVDPDFLIVIGPDAHSLMVVNPKPGFCYTETVEQEGVPHFTETDRRFLRALHIK